MSKKKKQTREIFRRYFNHGVSIVEISEWYAEFIEKNRHEVEFTQKEASEVYWSSYGKYVKVLTSLREKGSLGDRRYAKQVKKKKRKKVLR